MSSPWSHDDFCLWQTLEFAVHLCKNLKLTHCYNTLAPQHKALEDGRALQALKMGKHASNAKDLIDIDDVLQDAFLITQQRIHQWRVETHSILNREESLGQKWLKLQGLATVYPLNINHLLTLLYEAMSQGSCPNNEGQTLSELLPHIEQTPPVQAQAHTNAPRWHHNWLRSVRYKRMQKRIRARERQLSDVEGLPPILDTLHSPNPTDSTALFHEARSLLTHLQCPSQVCPQCKGDHNLASPLKRPLDRQLMGQPELWHEPDYRILRQLKSKSPLPSDASEVGTAAERQSLRRFNLRRTALTAFTLSPFDPSDIAEIDVFYAALAETYHKNVPGITTVTVAFFKGGTKDNNGVKSGVDWHYLWQNREITTRLYRSHESLANLLMQYPSRPRAVTASQKQGPGNRKVKQ